MSQDLAAAIPCSNHAHLPATCTCDQCGLPLCDQCRLSLIAQELDFCSEACRSRYTTRLRTQQGTPGHQFATNQELIDGLRHPFVNGAKLWARSLTPLLLRVSLPLAAITAVGIHLSGFAGTYSEPGFPLLKALIFIAVAAYIVFTIDMLTSRIYTGRSLDGLYTQVARRYLPTTVAWLILMVATLLGTLALIIPGIIAGIRLFWADEYALLQDKGPFNAANASIELTRGYSWRIWGHQVLTNLLGNLLFWVGFLLMLFTMSALPSVSHETFNAIFFPLTAFLFTLGYAYLHASEVIYFYGLQAVKQESGEKPEEPKDIGPQRLGAP